MRNVASDTLRISFSTTTLLSSCLLAGELLFNHQRTLSRQHTRSPVLPDTFVRLPNDVPLRLTTKTYEPTLSDHLQHYEPWKTNITQKRNSHMMERYRLVKDMDIPQQGNGGMALSIRVVQSRSSGRIYLEKQVPKKGKVYRAEVEIAALMRITRQGGREYNLNTMFEYMPGLDSYHIILEFCNGGDLRDSIWKMCEEGGNHRESFVWHVLVDCINALKFLHGGPVDKSGRQDPSSWVALCHLDVKPANIFFERTGDGYDRAVLGDFSGAVSNTDSNSGDTDICFAQIYTRGWKPPELLLKGEYGTKTDAWQLGGVIQVMCLLTRYPDPQANDRPCGKEYSQELSSVVSALTYTDIDRRSNAEDLASRAQQGLQMTTAQGR